MERFPKILDTLDSYFFALRVVSAGHHRITIQAALLVAALGV